MRRPRFRLRTLMIAVGVVGLLVCDMATQHRVQQVGNPVTPNASPK